MFRRIHMAVVALLTGLTFALLLPLTTAANAAPSTEEAALSAGVNVSAAAEWCKYVVNGLDGDRGLNVREGPRLKYPVRISVPMNAVVDGRTGLQPGDGYYWRYVRYQGYEGWSVARYLTLVEGSCH